MIFNVVSLFPEQLLQFMRVGVTGKAIEKNKVQLNTFNPRDFATDTHKTVDDRPYGGGDGMVLLPEVISTTLDAIDKSSETYYLSPQGRPWTDGEAKEWSDSDVPKTLICGRYGGVDQRVIDKYKIKEISIGDYVLSGGEIAAMAVMDSVIRKIPGVLGNETSAEEDSFSGEGGLEAPLYTRPSLWDGREAPMVLLSGHHEKINLARKVVSNLVTAIKRPDLISLEGRMELNKNINIAKTWSAKELADWSLSRVELDELGKKYE